MSTSEYESSTKEDKMLYILSGTITYINRDIALSNSFEVDIEERALLNEGEIIQFWKKEQYDAHWFMCVEKEAFVARLTNKWKDISLLTAIKLYEELRRRFLLANEKRYDHRMKCVDANAIDIDTKERKHNCKNKFIFIWENSVKQLKHCDHMHFLFISSLIIDEINCTKIENNAYPLFDRQNILYFFQRIQMNGLLFTSIKRLTFIKSLQYSMIQLSSLNDEINMLILTNLSDETPQDFAAILYDKLNTFDIQHKMKKEQICALNLDDKDSKWSKIMKTIHVISRNKHESIPSADIFNKINLKNEIDQKKHKMDIQKKTQSSPVSLHMHLHHHYDIKEWNKMIKFDDIDSIGYICDDSIVVIAHIIDRDLAIGNKIKLKFKTDYLSDPFLLNGLWINIPNEKICDPLNTTESHRHIFNKWIVILSHKLKYNMPFDRDLFETISKICDNHPMLLFTLKYDNYHCSASNKGYTEILKSFFSWSMTLKCQRTNCDKMQKMLCRCECNKFPLYTYHLLLALIRAKNEANDDMLHTLINKDNKRTMKGIIKEISHLLPDDLRDKTYETNYIKRYKDYIGYWLKFDFYNFVCSYCWGINCTIMVNRIYSYNSLLRNCRVCGTKKFEVKMHQNDDYLKVSDSIHWICEKLKDPDMREFEPERAKIQYINLRKALTKCRYDCNIFYDGSITFDEQTLFQILNSVLRHKWFFDAFYYYIRHFYGYDKWAELRINISLNYHFFFLDASYVNTKVLMKDAGFDGLYDENIFKDCYERAFCSNLNYDEDMMRLLFYGNDTLCVDHASLRGMERITQSVKKFAQEVIESVTVSESVLFGNEDESLNIIDHRWVYDHDDRKQTLDAIRIWSVDGDNGYVSGIQLQIDDEWDINKIYGSTSCAHAQEPHEIIFDLTNIYTQEIVNKISINFKDDQLRYIAFDTNLKNTIAGGDYGADGSYQSMGDKLIGLRITTNKDVITGLQFKWLHSKTFDDVHKKLMKVIKNLHKFKLNRDIFPILTLNDFRLIISRSSIYSTRNASYATKDTVESVSADTIWCKLHAIYPHDAAYTNELTYALIGDLAKFSSIECESPLNVGLLGQCIDGHKRKYTALKIKTVIAFYTKTLKKVPTFDEFLRDTKLELVDDVKDEICLKYNELYEKYNSAMQDNEALHKDMKHINDKQEEGLYNFLTGIFMRYTVLSPRFTCLAEECLLNEVQRINMCRWNQLLSEAKDIYHKINIFSSSESNKNFGIERNSPIAIQHIMSIKLYTDFTDYAHALSRSYRRLRLEKSDEKMIEYLHCNNFYWIGRFLYEAVEFFGERFDENKEYKLYQGKRHIYKFENFSCCLNYPSSTSNDKSVANEFAADKGCIIKFRPKYIGAGNNTKFMNISELSGFVGNTCLLFFGNTCELQIERITLHPNKDSLQLKEYLPALLYLEKILQQTMFNVQFYNSQHLYDNTKTTQKLLLKLIDIYLDFKEQKRNTDDILQKHFPNGKLHSKQIRAIRYIVSLLSFWCKEKEYVSFETLHLEYEYMIDKLRDFFVDKIRNRFYIKRKHIMNLLPNLKYYRNYDKQLIYMLNPHKKDDNEEIEEEDIWIKPLIQRKRSHSHNKVRFKPQFSTTKSEDLSLMVAMTRNTTSQDSVFTDFSEWETFTEIEENENISHTNNCNTRLISYVQPHEVPLIMLELLDEIGFDFEECLSVRKRAFRAEILKWNLTLFDVQDKERDTFVHILSKSLNVTRSMIDRVRANLCKKWVSKKVKKGKLATLLMDQLQTCGFKFNLDDNFNIEMDTYRAKRLFLELYKKPLSKFHAFIQNVDKTATKNFVDLAQEIKEVSFETATKLYEHLFRKILEEKSRIKPWKCAICWFQNRKLLIGKQWRFYNLSFECGLCGESRLPSCEKYPNLRPLSVALDIFKISEEDSSHLNEVKEHKEIQLPHYIKKLWKQIPKEQKCVASVRNMDNLFSLSMVLSAEEEESTDYDDDDDLPQIRNINRNTTSTGNESPLPLSLSNSHKSFELVKNCSTIHRICVILKYYHTLTEQLTDIQPMYKYEIKSVLSQLKGYSAIKLIDDVDHLLRYHDTINMCTINYSEIQQRYNLVCESYHNCVYARRSQRETHKLLDTEEKKRLFHSNNITDFVYISVLDRAHVLLLHADDDHLRETKKLLEKDTELIAKYSTYPVYSTGVFMQYDALSPLHLHLKEEMTSNKLCAIRNDEWTQSLEKAKLFIQSTNAKGIWRSNETNREHGIEKNDPLQIEHILSIIFYCDLSNVCEAFRSTYRAIAELNESDENVQQRHIEHFYWFGRFVYGAIQFCGEKPMKPGKNRAKCKPFYHGLKEKFLFNYFSASYETPTSTTYDLSVAQQFAGNEGIILELGPKYKNEVNYSRCLDVSTISDFTAEKERLFAGMTELAIINIIDLQSSAEEKFEITKYMKVILYFERLCEQTVYSKDYYNYGRFKKREKDFQLLYLAPLIRKQMQRNVQVEVAIDLQSNNNKQIPTYIAALFEHFCDSKHDYINLSCIDLEIQNMHKEIQEILFVHIDHKNINVQINNTNLKRIFPKLRKYKNPYEHWITLRD